MPVTRICPKCSNSVPLDAVAGVCPFCAFGMALVDTPHDELVTQFRPADGNALTVSDRGTKDGPRTAQTQTFPQIPGYEIIDRIGAGGGGAVYRARQVLSERVVALKILTEDVSPVQRERFRQEMVALAKLRHPNIVEIFDVGSVDDTLYYTMEWIPGGTLSHWIRSAGLTADQSARVVEIIADAVEACHDAGLLHRDLKPSNILLAEPSAVMPAPEGLPFIPKLADFGLTKNLPSAANDSDAHGLTVTGALLGTPAYMASEQADGRNRHTDRRTDVFGLGAVLYHGLIGSPPYQGENSAEVLAKASIADFPEPRTIDRSIPKALEAICMKCMELSPDDRYPTARMVADELRRFRTGEPLFVRPISNAQRIGRFLRRNARRFAAATAVVLLVALAAYGGQLVSRPRVSKPEDVIAEYRRELAAGRPITLIGDTGPPRWREVELGLPHEAASPLKDGVYCVDVPSESARIVLLPGGLLPPNYVLEWESRLELGHHQELLAAGVEFAGHVDQNGNGGSRHNYLRMTFNDYQYAIPTPPQNSQPIIHEPQARMDLRIERMSRERQRSAGSASLGALNLPHRVDGRLIPWQRFRVAVSPESVKADWVDDQGRLFSVASPDRLTQPALDAVFAKRSTQSPNNVAAPIFAQPARFHADGSISLYVAFCRSGFRNVRVIPTAHE